MILNGLTEFQQALLSASRNTESVMKLAVRNSGNIATREVRKTARRKVKKNIGNYHKSFKRGKVFTDANGYITVRVLNTSPHGHLVEYGHNQVLNPYKDESDVNNSAFKVGPNAGLGGFKTLKRRKQGEGIGEIVGFVPGAFPIREGIRQYENTGNFEQEVSEAVDKLLEQNRL